MLAFQCRIYIELSVRLGERTLGIDRRCSMTPGICEQCSTTASLREVMWDL